MKQIAITDFLTAAEIARAQALWRQLRGTGQFVAAVDAQIITPQMARINAALGQENNSRFLAYAVEYVFGEADARGWKA